MRVILTINLWLLHVVKMIRDKFLLEHIKHAKFWFYSLKDC